MGAASPEDIQGTILRLLTAHDWMVMRVSGDEDSLAWSYTIGLWERFGHPELIAVGLPDETSREILNAAGAEIRDDGAVFKTGVHYPQFAKGFLFKATATEPRIVWDHVQGARWYYLEHLAKAEPPPFIQFVWPDRTGKFPGEPDWQETPGWRQPILDGRLPY
jgi:hypothetical protein